MRKYSEITKVGTPSTYEMQNTAEGGVARIWNEGDWQNEDPHIEVYSIEYAKELIQWLEFFIQWKESKKEVPSKELEV